MANIHSVMSTPTSYTITGTNGVTATVSKAEVQAFYQTTSGNATQRRTAVISWIKETLSSRVGGSLVYNSNSRCILPEEVLPDYDNSTFDLKPLMVVRPDSLPPS